MEEYAAVLCIDCEVVTFLQELYHFVTPVAIRCDEAVLLHRPPATFRSRFTEQEAGSPNLFHLSTPCLASTISSAADAWHFRRC
jgi:hypothetical protein